MIENNPSPSSILNGRRTSAGTIAGVSVPPGTTATFDITISGGITLAGTANPTVTLSTAGTSNPANGAVVADLSLAGLALVSVAGSTYTEVCVANTDATHNVDLVFALGGASAASVVINGHTF